MAKCKRSAARALDWLVAEGCEVAAVVSSEPDRWTTEAQRDTALASRDMFQEELSRARYGAITTEIVEAGPFYYAEDYHQQYLEANPNGYCGLGGTGVSCPIGTGVASNAPS